MPLSLDRYLARIAYGGTTAPTLDTLHALTKAHTCAIPFENLDVLLGRGIDLTPDTVFAKLVDARRGGYCFEQNQLFGDVLSALGFRVRPIGARVRWQRPRETTPPRTHLFLTVELAGETWLTDVGVGGMSLTSAIRLDVDGEQATPHEPRRILREDGRLFHQARLGDAWHDVCELTLETMHPIDCEVANWFTSAHPASHFKNRLLVARATDRGRITLLDDTLTIREGDAVEKRVVRSHDELVGVLEASFGLRLPEGARLTHPPFPASG